jgi:hypothetical protein
MNEFRQGRSLTLQMGVYPLHQGPPTLDWENRHIAAAARRCNDVVATLIDDPNNPGFLERVSEAMRRLRLSSETDELHYGEVEDDFDEEGEFPADGEC